MSVDGVPSARAVGAATDTAVRLFRRRRSCCSHRLNTTATTAYLTLEDDQAKRPNETKSLKMLMPTLLDRLTDAARESPRQRSHHNLHPSLEASVQRLAIAMEPGTYVRPHRHRHTWELLIPLRGRFLFTAFDDGGTVQSHQLLGSAEGLSAFEFEAGTRHTVTALEPGSVVFEVKEGPYAPVQESDLAAWSPPEGTPKATQFVADLRAKAALRSGSTGAEIVTLL